MKHFILGKSGKIDLIEKCFDKRHLPIFPFFCGRWRFMMKLSLLFDSSSLAKLLLESGSCKSDFRLRLWDASFNPAHVSAIHLSIRKGFRRWIVVHYSILDWQNSVVAVSKSTDSTSESFLQYFQVEASTLKLYFKKFFSRRRTFLRHLSTLITCTVGWVNFFRLSCKFDISCRIGYWPKFIETIF